MRFLVTGGGGFIGHNVVRILEQQGHECIIIDTCTDYGFIPKEELTYLIDNRLKRINAQVRKIDIREGVFVDTIFKTYKPDVVIHMASFPRQKVVEQNPLLASDVMSSGLINLLEKSKQHKVKKFVYISSSMVYGDFTADVLEAHICRPQGQYGIMKLMGEKLVEDYHRTGAFDYTIIRPSAVYGEWDVEDRVVSKFVTKAMRGETLKVNGPDEVLDFTYVEDTAMGIVLAATLDRANSNIYNITRSEQRQWNLKDAAELAIQIAGQGSLEVAARDLSFPKRGRLSIMKAQRDLGYAPQVNVEEGFRRYYEWYLANPVLWKKTNDTVY
jgi:nucleoside-diphosphate-sugar epimerase